MLACTLFLEGVLDANSFCLAMCSTLEASNRLRSPPTAKAGITARGGYWAEAHHHPCGLDIEEKAAFLHRQVRQGLDESVVSIISQSSTLLVRTKHTGSAVVNWLLRLQH